MLHACIHYVYIYIYALLPPPKGQPFHFKMYNILLFQRHGVRAHIRKKCAVVAYFVRVTSHVEKQQRRVYKLSWPGGGVTIYIYIYICIFRWSPHSMHVLNNIWMSPPPQPRQHHLENMSNTRAFHTCKYIAVISSCHTFARWPFLDADLRRLSDVHRGACKRRGSGEVGGGWVAVP